MKIICKESLFVKYNKTKQITMNVNYTDLKLEDYPQEVRERYAFPNQNQVQRYLYQQEPKDQFAQNIQIDMVTALASITAGSYAYLLYNLPAGKVIRDKIRSQMSFPKRVLVHGLPFVGIALGLTLARKHIEGGNGYRQ